jgi:hypothetical protein
MKRPIDHAVVVTGLEPEQQNAVLDFACHLVTQSGVSSIFDYLQPISIGSDMEIEQRRKIATEINRKGLTKQLPVAAMLVAELVGPWKEKLLFEKLQTYVLVGAIRFPDRLSTIRLACRRLRLIKNKNSRWIFDRLTRADNDLPSVVACLEKLEAEIQGSADTPSRTAKLARVSELRVLLADYMADLDRKPTGPTGPRGDRFDEELIRAPLSDHLHVAGLKAAKIIHCAERGPYKGAVPAPIESQRYLDYQTKPQRSYRSYKAKQYRDARHATNDIRMRAVSAPCDWNSLTSNEVHSILRVCFEGINGDNPLPDALIISSILLGRKPRALLGLPFCSSHRKSNPREYWYVTKTKLQFTMQIEMPELPKNENMRALAKSAVNRLSLSLPDSLQSPIRELRKLDCRYRQQETKIADQIKERVQALKKAHCDRLTEKRWATFMHSHLAAKGVDEVVIKRLRGVSLKMNVPQHYDACPQRLTQSVHEDYVRSLLAAISRDADWTPVDSPNAPLGSTMCAKPAAVRLYFEKWRERITEILKASQDPVFVHNEYVLATFAVLSACTGYRPVRHMFENIKDFDRVSRELFIVDKASRFDSDARCIVLPTVAREQIERYITHLEALQRRAWGRDMSAVVAARRALSGDGPFLFRVSQDEDSLGDVEIFDPGMVEDWLGGRWPLTLNWARHFLRTDLSTRGAPFELVNAMLGHSDVAPAAFDRFSKLSYRRMADIASWVDDLLADLSVSAIEGLGRW